MHVAGLPHFRKRWGRILQDLQPGNYIIQTNNSKPLTYEIFIDYNVGNINGKKYVVLSTTNYLGGNNIILGGFFVAVACLSFLLCSVFLVAYNIKQKDNSQVQGHQD